MTARPQSPPSPSTPARQSLASVPGSQAMIGTPVRYCGQIYVIEDLDFLGWYGLVRYDAGRRVWQRTAVQTNPNEGPVWRHWEVVGQWHKKRLQWAILNAERLHPWLEIRSKSARHWRRGRACRNVLRRFFRRIQKRAAPRPADVPSVPPADEKTPPKKQDD